MPWTLIKDLGRIEYGKNGYKKRKGLYMCSCGSKHIVATSDVLRGKSTRCNKCKGKITTKNFTVHGGSDTRLYKVWSNMKTRCSNPNATYYHNYGGRGISVCKEWMGFKEFSEWALLNGYKDNLTIDRKDNNKGYSPQNCRWATSSIQVSNKSDTLFFKFGIDKLSEICEFYENTKITQKKLASMIGVSPASISNLVNGKHNYTPA